MLRCSRCSSGCPKTGCCSSARYVAVELGVDETAAEQRLSSLAASGNVAEVWGGFENGKWTILAYGLTARGRDALRS